MEIRQPPATPDRIEATTGEILQCKILAIPPWDMDTQAHKVVAHGLSKDDIKSVRGYVRDDFDGYYSSLEGITETGAERGSINWDATEIDCLRSPGGDFDRGSFDGMGFDRGFVIVWYKV